MNADLWQGVFLCVQLYTFHVKYFYGKYFIVYFVDTFWKYFIYCTARSYSSNVLDRHSFITED